MLDTRFTMWPSSRTFGWNSQDVGPKRLVEKFIGENEEEIRKCWQELFAGMLSGSLLRR